MRATAFEGLSALIDTVAEAAPDSHRFLRYQWFAAATAAYGLRARTLIVEHDGDPVIALPFASFGPGPARLAMVPGCYWPFRGFPAAEHADAAAFDTLLDRLGQEVNGLRIGPSYDGDPATSALIAAAQRRGWAVLDRFVADSYALDMVAAQGEEGGWPRGSTLKKNRFHEKHLAEHGALDWTLPVGRRSARGRVRPARRDRGEELDRRAHRRQRRQVHADRPRRVLAPGGGRSGGRRACCGRRC